jgi:hypothetical protein
VPEEIHLIGNCPHDWLFKRVSLVVHHGGAGTTAAGIAAGRPTVVVPIFGDQPFWGQMIARAGAGPEPVPFKKMTAQSLASSITAALKPDIQAGAQRMSENIAREDGAKETAHGLQNRLIEEERLHQCDVCPERLATWKHKKTGRRLSGFAVFCLVDKRLIQPHEVKLLRHKNWYVDEGAEDPLVGIAASFAGFVTNVATATSDYSRSLKHWPEMRAPAERATSDMNLSLLKIGQEDNYGFEPARQGDAHDGVLNGVIRFDTLTPTQMEMTAMKLAKKSLRSINPEADIIQRLPTLHDRQKAAWKSREQGRNGRAWYITRATGRYAAELTKAGLKVPVAFFWNTANGFHNLPSYGFAGIEVRRRDQITGLGSGLRTAGMECVLGLWDAFVGIVVEPYKAIKDEGAKGVGKGIWRGGRGIFSNLGCCKWFLAIFFPTKLAILFLNTLVMRTNHSIIQMLIVPQPFLAYQLTHSRG